MRGMLYNPLGVSAFALKLLFSYSPLATDTVICVHWDFCTVQLFFLFRNSHDLISVKHMEPKLISKVN